MPKHPQSELLKATSYNCLNVITITYEYLDLLMPKNTMRINQSNIILLFKPRLTEQLPPYPRRFAPTLIQDRKHK